MLKYLLFISGMTTGLLSVSQVTPSTKYRDAVFPAVDIQKSLAYFTEPSGKKKNSELFDLYQPQQDSSLQRPLIIWMHGGGFKFGSKRSRGIRMWSESFARRGYVCAAINYKLGKKNFRFGFNELVKNCYFATQDAEKAVVFFKDNCARLRIDTNRIILAGNSAGGMIALQAAYGNRKNFLTLLGKDSTDLAGSIDRARVAAVVNFWGGIFDSTWLQNARVPIVSVHGNADRIVPYDHKGFPLYGSLAIHRMAESLRIPNALKTYEGYSHELQKHFNPVFVSAATRRRWLEAGQFSADFLYKLLFAERM